MVTVAGIVSSGASVAGNSAGGTVYKSFHGMYDAGGFVVHVGSVLGYDAGPKQPTRYGNVVVATYP